MRSASHLIDFFTGHPGEPSHCPEISVVSGHVFLKFLVHQPHVRGEILPDRICAHASLCLKINTFWSKWPETGIQVGIIADD